MRHETEIAIKAVTAAIQIADSREGADDVSSKGGIDLVTATDVKNEDVIRNILMNACPDYTIVGEERGGSPSDDTPYWLVDPICGTRPYASDVPLYCTNIALVENGTVTVAAIALGKSGEVMYAEKGNGARVRTESGDQVIAVSDNSNTLWLGGRGLHAANTVRNAMLEKRWYIWQFSSSIAYPYTAAGRVSGLVHFATHLPMTPVHTAAGCFVTEEAGGIVTDTDGNPWDLDATTFILAATQELHNELREIIEKSR